MKGGRGGGTAPEQADAAGAAGGGATTSASLASPKVLTQRGFVILVKLIDELQFEKELEEEKGVGLVPGPVCVV